MARGFAIVFMLFFNTLSVISYDLPGFLEHGENEMMPGDIIAPIFRFVLGVSLVLSVGKRTDRGEAVWKHVLKRALLLILLGYFLDWAVSGFQELNWGILQSLGVCLVVAYPFMSLSCSRRVTAVALMLAAYSILMATVPWFYDSVVNSMHGGILGSVSYTTIAILGTVAGTWLYKKKENAEKVIAFGFAILVLSLLLNFFIPFNRTAVSASFILFASGFCFMLVALFYIIGERMKKDIVLFSMFGRNALVMWITQYLVLFFPLLFIVQGCCFFYSWMAIGPAIIMMVVYYVIADILDWKKIRMPFYN